MGDPHRIIIREVQAQPIGDLLRAPGLPPPPVLARAVTPADPPNLRARDNAPVRPLHSPRQAVLHIAAQLRVGRQLGGLRSPAAPVGVPLRGRCPIGQRAAASPGVTAQLPRDRRRRATDPPGDLAHPQLLGAQQSDLLPLGERQVTPRQRDNSDRWHPATLTKPSDANGLRHASLNSRLHARDPTPDRGPEPHPMLSPPRGRPPRRTLHRPARLTRCPPLRPAHRNLLDIECCDDRLNPPGSFRGL